MARRLLIRQDAQSPWIDNFGKGGWHVYAGPDTSASPARGIARKWVKMLPSNTKILNKDGEWECVK
jgi:hypothetical protein